MTRAAPFYTHSHKWLKNRQTTVKTIKFNVTLKACKQKNCTDIIETFTVSRKKLQSFPRNNEASQRKEKKNAPHAGA